MKQTILIILSCMLLPFYLAAQKNNITIWGKAGARGMMPENTIIGMLKALELGVNVLDMDVVISKDQQVLLSQEPYFNQEISLSPKGKALTLKNQKDFNIYKMDYAEVRQFDVGSKPHPRFPGQANIKSYKPLLSEVIDSVEFAVKKKRYKKPMYAIEIKTIPKGDKIFHPEPEEFIDLVMEVAIAKKITKRLIIQSFDLRSLKYLHQKYPKIQTTLLIDEKEAFEDYIQELGFNPTYYSPYSVLVGKNLIDKCHARGIKIIPWTINSRKEYEKFKAMGVDGILTDYPNLFYQQR